MGTAVNYQNQLPPIPMSPLSGFLSGMNQDYANQFSNQDLSDMALQHQINQQKLDLATQLQPGQVAESQATGAKAAQDQGYYDSGAYSAARTSADAAKAAQNSATTTSANVDQSMAQAQLMAQFGQEAYGMRGRSPLDSGVQSWWSGWKQRLAPYYPNMPDHGDAGDIEQAIQTGNVATQSLMQNPAFKQKMELTKAAPEIAAAGGLAEAQERSAGGLAEAKERAAATRYGADKAADSRVAVAQLNLQKLADAQTQLNVLISTANKTGWTPDIVGQVEYEAIQSERAKAEMKLAGTIAGLDPKTRMAFLNDAKDQAKMLLQNIPGYVAAKQKFGNTGTVAPPPETAPAASTTPKTTPPKIGDIQMGHRYNGGDPADAKSWTKVQ